MNRVDGQLAMSRAIGDWQYKANPDLKMEEQKVIAVPEIRKAKVYEGDHLLICCDGIVEQMSSEDASKFAFEAMSKQREEKQGEDVSLVCWELNRYSLERGSKDNHSCMIVSFEDGTTYQRDDEFIAGPYHPFKRDQSFSNAYLSDAKKHGYEGEILMEMARKTEASMPNLPNMEESGAGGGGNVSMGIQALQALMGQPGEVSEKLLMLSNMLSADRGTPGQEGDEGEFEEEDESGPG